jgi:putative transcriptional regulator
VRRLERVGATLLDSLPTVDVDETVLNEVLARLDEPAPQVVATHREWDWETQTVVPAPLRRYLGRNLKDLPWKRVGRMFEEVRLPLALKGMKAALMRLEPGALMPRHSHRGSELTVVLAGGYSDGGESFQRGDFDCKVAVDEHQPLVDNGERCICLVVLDAPVRLSGAVGVLVNPFLRI